MSKEGTVRHRQSREASVSMRKQGISIHEEARELPRERDNARKNARYDEDAMKTTHGLDGHQDVDRAPRGRGNQNDREWR